MSGTFSFGISRARAAGDRGLRHQRATGEAVAHVREVDAAGTTSAIAKAHVAFLEWRLVPAPKRGELVRLLGEELRANKRALGRLASIEVGKIESEGLGEVQEMIDICDYAVGLSRQLPYRHRNAHQRRTLCLAQRHPATLAVHTPCTRRLLTDWKEFDSRSNPS
jgi:acyl-CoA reductase-like NAD-dependent aldehyde dehydrogenase